jgi:hypothetical protein
MPFLFGCGAVAVRFGSESGRDDFGVFVDGAEVGVEHARALPEPLDVDFPAEALKAKKLKEIRLELAYIPSPFHQETVKLSVTIGGK